jgi:hypothetical protein
MKVSRRVEVAQLELPQWTERLLEEPDGEGEPRDPLRAQMTLDHAADGLFKSGNIGVTSLTDHLGYLALHGWLKYATEKFFDSPLKTKEAYHRVFWLHGLANRSLAMQAKQKGRWAVYGISSLKKIERITGDEAKRVLVVLDPSYRYNGMWLALNEGVRQKTLQAWKRVELAKGGKIKKWMGGDLGEVTLKSAAEWKDLRLDKPGRFHVLAKYLQNLKLRENGIGLGLPKNSLGQVLDHIRKKAGKRSPDVETWTWEYLKSKRCNGAVEERLRRAFIIRAIIYAANWAFYDWAEDELKMEDAKRRTKKVRPKSRPESPELILSQVNNQLKSDRQLQKAIENTDNAVARPAPSFSLRKCLENPERIRDWARCWAQSTEKGFVDSRGSINHENRTLIADFSGDFAGSLRMRQAWRFGLDLKEASNA